jgi:dihydrofolate synthase / folylpolyglutamate synthase
MQFIPIKTRKLLPPKDDLYEVLGTHLPPLEEDDVLLVTSKVVAIHQGRCIPKGDVPDKDALMRSEAESYIERDMTALYPIMLTIKHHTLIASAGIDESNANGHYILWPEHIQQTAQEIWQHVRKIRNITNLGVIITDSHSLPLRWGVLGVAIGFFGFEPTTDLRGKSDIFGRVLTMTRQNIPDAIAGLGVLMMGEANECTPMLVARGLDFVTYTDKDRSEEFWVDQKDDMFGKLLDVFEKK